MTDAHDRALIGEVQSWLRAVARDVPVVVVPVYDAYDDVLECARNLLAVTRADAPIVLFDDMSADARIPEALGALQRPGRLMYARKAANTGFVETINLAFRACAPHDVVIVNSDIIVPPEWLERLQAAAYCRSTVATATPFSNNGSILSLPYRNRPTDELPGGLTVVEVDRRVRAASRLLRPALPTAVGYCAYFKRLALDVAGLFDPIFSPGYGEEVDFAQRAIMAGMSHVLADDLFVYHKGARSFNALGRQWRQRLIEAHEEIVNERYPWYPGAVVEAKRDQGSALAEAIGRAGAALIGRRIAIDATCLGGVVNGTHVATLELLRALAELPERPDHLTAIVAAPARRAALGGLERLIDEVVSLDDLRAADGPCFDLVHRPFQLYNGEELALLRRIAGRLVVSHLDSIMYANPAYWVAAEEWREYRALTQLAFASADGIAFISDDAIGDAAHQGLFIPSERVANVYLGVDHDIGPERGQAPGQAAAFAGRPFILMLGTNYRHKNRVFAIRVVQELIAQHQWPGALAFAGPEAAWGSSEQQEAEARLAGPGLRDRVFYLGPVGEPARRWLLANAALALVPSLSEGFGFVAFEAAAAGTPALTSRLSAIAEVLGDDVAYFDAFDPQEGARRAWPLLTDRAAAERQIAAINARAAGFTWRRHAELTWRFYERILDLPPRQHGSAAPAGAAEMAAFIKARRALPAPERAPAPAGRPGAMQEWRRRLSFGARVWREEGFQSLRREIRRYIRWRMAKL